MLQFKFFSDNVGGGGILKFHSREKWDLRKEFCVIRVDKDIAGAIQEMHTEEYPARSSRKSVKLYRTTGLTPSQGFLWWLRRWLCFGTLIALLISQRLLWWNIHLGNLNTILYLVSDFYSNILFFCGTYAHWKQSLF